MQSTDTTESRDEFNGLVKASLTHLGSLEHLVVDWNPRRYALSRRSSLATAGALGSAQSRVQAIAGGEDLFSTELFLDGTQRRAGERDVRPLVDKLESWMDPEPATRLPPRVAFVWGSFRFRGVIESLEQVWVRFDPDGTPVRGHVRLVLRR